MIKEGEGVETNADDLFKFSSEEPESLEPKPQGKINGSKVIKVSNLTNLQSKISFR